METLLTVFLIIIAVVYFLLLFLKCPIAGSMAGTIAGMWAIFTYYAFEGDRTGRIWGAILCALALGVLIQNAGDIIGYTDDAYSVDKYFGIISVRNIGGQPIYGIVGTIVFGVLVYFISAKVPTLVYWVAGIEIACSVITFISCILDDDYGLDGLF